MFPEEPAQDEIDRYDAPLAARMRPRTLDEFVGQHQVIGEQAVLRRAINADRIPSIILWGPPGSGKTTLANLLARQSHAAFVPLSAVSAGVADLRQAAAAAKQRRQRGQRTLLFVDEIHRLNKSQQDAVLPHVENGTVTLVGATTENPSFEVNAALLSRCRVFRLEPLSADALGTIIDRALADTERGLGAADVSISEDARSLLIEQANGDARTALNALELAAASTGSRAIDREAIAGALANPLLLHDKTGDMHYHLASALIKSIRGSDPDAAVYYLARLLEGGEDPVFVARRLVILAAEDIGLADPQALSVAVAAQQAAHFIGMPEGYLPLTQAALYLATAPKSNSTIVAYGAAKEAVQETLNAPVPLYLRNAVVGMQRNMGYGAGYKYAHDYAGDATGDVPMTQRLHEYLPDSLKGRRFYSPSVHGQEARVKAWLESRIEPIDTGE